jgi:hypothetical protein
VEIQFPKVKRFEGNVSGEKRTWDRCIVCNRPVDMTANMVHLSTRGGFLVDEPEDHPHSQGWFPCGPECWKKIEAAIKNAKADA